MSSQERVCETCSVFAEALDYPTTSPAHLAKMCSSLLPDPRAASMMESFAAYCEGHSLEQLQEVYTRTFDLQPSCSPYLGHQLFGDSYRRGDFLARLKERYEETGLALGTELPDHLTLVLRFIALSKGSAEAEELTRYCLLPALDRMVVPLLREGNPYAQPLQALALTMGPPCPTKGSVSAEVKAD